jgi:calcium/calmodulin-dependent protein kinase I
MISNSCASGAFAEVKEATDKKSNQQYAVKIISKAKCKGFEEQLVREIAILKKMNHPNIVNLYNVWETSESVYMLME